MPEDRGALKYRYTGNRDEGEHLSGVPATNLYEADLEALPADLRKQVSKSPIYKPADAPDQEPRQAPRPSQAPTKEPNAGPIASQNKTGAAAPAQKSAGGEKK